MPLQTKINKYLFVFLFLFLLFSIALPFVAAYQIESLAKKSAQFINTSEAAQHIIPKSTVLLLLAIGVVGLFSVSRSKSKELQSTENQPPDHRQTPSD